jgi:hypothetical protein
MSLGSLIALYYLKVYVAPSSDTTIWMILFCYLVVLFLPGFSIDFVFRGLRKGNEEDIATKCGGLQFGGVLIGYSERSLIFLAIVIAYYDAALSYASILSFLTVIVGGKALFRYSSKSTDDRACADWYILGTLMSITMALAFSWWFFRFLVIG